MKSFLEWLDQDGFYSKQVWDFETNKWSKTPGLIKLFDYQRRILGHCFTPNPDGSFPYVDIVYSAPKKSGKTVVLALILEWMAECGPAGAEYYSCANDMEQAQSRAFADIDYHVTHKLGIKATAKRVDYENGTFIQVLAQHYASAAGSRQSGVIFDELWAYASEKSRRMWAEMTPPPTIENSMRIVATYAGFENESDQLLDMYNLCFKKENGKFVNGEVVPELADIVNARGESVCRRNGRTFIYWDSEPRLPWQNSTYYESQLQTLRPADFLRMHRNQWVSSTESFIPVELWDRATKKLQGPITLIKNDPRAAMPISVGIDIGMKHDCSALVGVCYDASKRKVQLAFHKIWTPPQRTDKHAEMLDLEFTVEQELLALWKQYRIVSVVYDPMQFQRSAVTLARQGLPLVEFQQQGNHMGMASQNLYDLLKTGNLEVYPDPELRDHVRYAAAETTARGFRIVKGKNHKYAIDAAIALAMAAYDAVNRGGADTSTPFEMIMPFSDASAVHIPTISDIHQRALPDALRD
jgi:phage terminase large subunit-like protein